MDLPRYAIVGARPVKLAPSPEGGLSCLVYQWKTGLFRRDMGYLTRVLFPEGEVDEVPSEAFLAAVEALRRELGFWETPKTLVACLGSEYAPDAPHGLERLRLGTDGRLCYQSQVRGHAQYSETQVEPGRVKQLIQGLLNAGFPEPPEHLIPPGASILELSLEGVGEALHCLLHFHQSREWEGYGPVSQWLDLGLPALRQAQGGLFPWPEGIPGI